MACNTNTQQRTYNDIPIPSSQRVLSPEERNQVMLLVIDSLLQSGLPEINLTIACGIAGNVKVESQFNYTAVNQSSGAYGLCQWYQTRFENLYNWCTQNNQSYTSPNGQIKFLIHELKEIPTYKKVYNTISSQDYRNDIDKIAYYFCMHFEIPGEQYCQNRAANARQVLQDYKRLKGLS